MLEIQKHIPIPDARSAPKAYPFQKMDIGDSFSVPLSARKNARVAASVDAQRNGRKYVTRTLVEDGKYICRLWRTA